MSDERDDAAPAVMPARPTGKRPRQRTQQAEAGEITEAMAVELSEDDGKTKKGKAKKKADGGPSRNPFVFVFTYLQQVVAELRKVIWPNRKQMVTYTSVVLVFLVFMVTLISGVDLGLAKVVLMVFG